MSVWVIVRDQCCWGNIGGDDGKGAGEVRGHINRNCSTTCSDHEEGGERERGEGGREERSGRKEKGRGEGGRKEWSGRKRRGGGKGEGVEGEKSRRVSNFIINEYTDLLNPVMTYCPIQHEPSAALWPHPLVNWGGGVSGVVYVF